MSSDEKFVRKKLGFLPGTAFSQLNQQYVILWHFICFKPKLTSVIEPLLSFCKLTTEYDFLELRLCLKKKYTCAANNSQLNGKLVNASLAVMFLITYFKDKVELHVFYYLWLKQLYIAAYFNISFFLLSLLLLHLQNDSPHSSKLWKHGAAGQHCPLFAVTGWSQSQDLAELGIFLYHSPFSGLVCCLV